MTSRHHVAPVIAEAAWQKSSYSGGQGNCVEVADGIPGAIPVRDSTRPTGPVLNFRDDTWDAFLRLLR